MCEASASFFICEKVYIMLILYTGDLRYREITELPQGLSGVEQSNSKVLHGSCIS